MHRYFVLTFFLMVAAAVGGCSRPNSSTPLANPTPTPAQTPQPSPFFAEMFAIMAAVDAGEEPFASLDSWSTALGNVSDLSLTLVIFAIPGAVPRHMDSDIVAVSSLLGYAPILTPDRHLPPDAIPIWANALADQIEELAAIISATDFSKYGEPCEHARDAFAEEALRYAGNSRTLAIHGLNSPERDDTLHLFDTLSPELECMRLHLPS